MTVAYIVTAALIAVILYSVYQFQQLIQLRSKKNEIMGESKSSPNKLPKLLNNYAQKNYNLILRIPVLKTIVLRIRKKLETLALYDEFSLRREVMKIVYSIMAVVLVASIILLIFRPSWIFVFWLCVGLLLISGVLVDFFIFRVENRLLNQLKAYINRTRFGYQETKMVDEAIYDALPYAGPEMKAHAERIVKILNSEEPEEELEKYEEVAPTRYLKIFTALTLLVKERGDNISKEKGSSYLKGISAVNKELNAEVLHRSKLRYALRSLPVLAVIPIFLARPIQNYVSSTFPTTESFYSSRIGFFAEIAVYAMCIGSYLIIRKMREVSETTIELKAKKMRWETWLLLKVPILEKMCIALSPKNYSKKSNKLKQWIKEANENITIPELTLKKGLLFIGAFLILIVSLSYSHIREEKNALNLNANAEALYTASYTEKEQEILNQQTEFDKEIINQLKQKENLPTQDGLLNLIAANLGEDVTSDEVKNAYQRIADKWTIITNAYLKWWEVVLALVFAYAISQIPVYVLHYKRRARLKLMETEVYQLLVLVSILREFEGMNVTIILEWLERFSIAFKESIAIAREEFDSGPEAALEKLEETNTFEPFQQIIVRLKLTLERLSIEESFDDIDIEREFYLEQRQDDLNRELNSKSNMGNMLGLVPIASVVIILMIFPIMYIAIKESRTIMNVFGY